MRLIIPPDELRLTSHRFSFVSTLYAHLKIFNCNYIHACKGGTKKNFVHPSNSQPIIYGSTRLLCTLFHAYLSFSFLFYLDHLFILCNAHCNFALSNYEYLLLQVHQELILLTFPCTQPLLDKLTRYLIFCLKFIFSSFSHYFSYNFAATYIL